MSFDCFTADLHLGHGNILKYCKRPGLDDRELDMLKNGVDFKVSRESVHRMNDYLIEGINKVVSPSDRLRILGDFCFCDRKYLSKDVHSYLGRIKCKEIHLVYGNHDEDGNTEDGEVGSYDRNQDIGQYFATACHYDEMRMNGQKIILFHYAQAVWNKSHRGSWMLCGHSHSTLNPWLNQHMASAKILDVGVDNAKLLLGEYRPFTFDEIKKYMDKKKGHSLDHHTSAENPS